MVLQRFVRSVWFALVVILGLANHCCATNLNNLKEIYSILPEPLREFSVLDGAIAWETGAIMRLYDVGHATPGEPVSTDFTDPTKYQNFDWDTCTIESLKKQRLLPLLLPAQQFGGLLQGPTEIEVSPWYENTLAFFAQKIDNPDTASGLIYSLKKMTGSLFNLMKFCIERHSDKNHAQLGVLRLYAAAVNGGLQAVYTEAIAVAQDGMQSGDYNIEPEAFNLWSALLWKLQSLVSEDKADDKNINEAIKVARFGMQSGASQVKSMALGLWSALVRKKEGIKEAKDAARDGVKDDSANVRGAALYVWRVLFEKNQVFEEDRALLDDPIVKKYADVVEGLNKLADEHSGE